MDTKDYYNTSLRGPLYQDALWQYGYGPKEYGMYLLNKRGYSHKRTNKF